MRIKPFRRFFHSVGISSSVLLALTIVISGCKPHDKAVAAGTLEPVDLKPFVNYSAFDDIQAGWLLPKGLQVFDGVPFQVDGAVQLFGSGRPGGQGHVHAPTSVTGIPVNRAFDRLHLLTAVDGSTTEGAVVARIKLTYSDGSEATLDLKYGDQVRNWTAPWHRSERPLRDTNCCVAWQAQASDPAAVDRFARLFHVVLQNPKPGETVQTISLETVVTNVGPLFAGITTGPENAVRQTNTVNLSKTPFPDLRRRQGDLASGKGVVRTWNGQPIGGAKVRVVSSRKLNTHGWEGVENLPNDVSALTDDSGRFILPPLPDNRLYMLVISKTGMRPENYYGDDPKSDPIEVRLRQLETSSGAQTNQR